MPTRFSLHSRVPFQLRDFTDSLGKPSHTTSATRVLHNYSALVYISTAIPRPSSHSFVSNSINSLNKMDRIARIPLSRLSSRALRVTATARQTPMTPLEPHNQLEPVYAAIDDRLSTVKSKCVLSDSTASLDLIHVQLANNPCYHLRFV